jgi:SAM-dependent methyltransferase
MNMSKRLDPTAWTAYWRRGALGSFQGDFGPNSQRIYDEFWSRIFAAAPAASTLLDLGSGNGMLALRAQRFADRRLIRFRVIGIDSADIDPAHDLSAHPQAAAALHRIEFHPNTTMEATGLDQGSVRLAISQFGLEYGDPRPTVAELDRVLDPDHGALVALVHHHDSAILAQVQRRLREIKHCDRSRLLELAGQLLQLEKEVASANQPASRLRQARQAFSEAQARLLRFSNEIENPVHIPFLLRGLSAVLSRKPGTTPRLEERRRALGELRERHLAIAASMRDIRDVALDDDGIRTWLRLLQRHGLGEQRVVKLQSGNQFFCIGLLAQRQPVNRNPAPTF